MSASIMNFRVSDAYIKKQNKNAIYTILFFAIPVCLFAFLALSTHKSSSIGLLIVGSFIFAQLLIVIYKKFKDGRAAYPTFEINNESQTVYVRHKNTTVSFPLSDIEKLRLQYRSEQIESIFFNTKSGQQFTIKGYENIEAMAEVFQQFTPTGKVKRVKWFHR